MAKLKEVSVVCSCGRPARFFIRGENVCENCIDKVIKFEKREEKKE